MSIYLGATEADNYGWSSSGCVYLGCCLVYPNPSYIPYCVNKNTLVYHSFSVNNRWWTPGWILYYDACLNWLQDNKIGGINDTSCIRLCYCTNSGHYACAWFYRAYVEDMSSYCAGTINAVVGSGYELQANESMLLSFKYPHPKNCNHICFGYSEYCRCCRCTHYAYTDLDAHPGWGNIPGWMLFGVYYDTERCDWYAWHIAPEINCFVSGKVTPCCRPLLIVNPTIGIHCVQFCPNGPWWKTTIGEIIIENRWWSKAEIAQYYNNTKARFGL